MLSLGLNMAAGSVVQSSALLLLDTYTGAAAAYSLRKLRSDYNGKVVQVRRSGTNTEVGVSFDASGGISLDSTIINTTEDTTGSSAGLTTSAANLGEFVNAASYNDADGLGYTPEAFVVKWYDQSGNTNDAIQLTAGSQPKIVASGAVIVENGKPAVEFDGTDDFLTHPISWVTSGNFTYVDTFKSSDTGAMLHSTTVGWYPWVMISATSTNTALSDAFVTGWGSYYKNGTLPLSSGATRTDLQNAFFDGSQNLAFYFGSTTSTMSNMYLGRYTSGYIFSGKLQESILYMTDHSGVRAEFETNINTFYSIY